MRPLSRTLSVLAAILCTVVTSQAQMQGGSQRRGVAQACRTDITTLCSGISPGGGAILRCMRENAGALSVPCRSALGEAFNSGARTGLRRSGESAQAGKSATVRADAKVLRNVAYGSDPRQRMDIYVPKGVSNAPVILMVHGGGWRRGSKTAAGVVDNKVKYWLPKGYIFISADNRLLPQADPLVQAQDVAKALATAQAKARSFGGDPGRFVLMGHSAGAHLVALLSADPGIARRAGALPWRGVVALDSAAYDVPTVMRSPHPKLYDDAFGNDRTFWRQASPSDRVTGAARPMFMVCSSRRSDSCEQARAMQGKARASGVSAQVLPLNKSHGEINADLGKPGAYTEAVDRFIRSILR